MLLVLFPSVAFGAVALDEGSQLTNFVVQIRFKIETVLFAKPELAEIVVQALFGDAYHIGCVDQTHFAALLPAHM